MPVLSNSLVTRALSPAELEAAGLKSTVFITDTRTLRFTTGCCRTAACRSAAAARSMAPTRRTRATWPCSRPGWRVFPAARRGRGLFLVGLGGRQPRHDAARDPAGSGAAGLLRVWLRRQRRVVLGACRPPAGAAADGPGRPEMGPADLRLALPGHLFAPFRRLGQSLLYRWYYLRDEMLEDGGRRAGLRPPPACGSGAPPARRAMPSICSSRIEVKPIRRKLRGALASSMKNTLPGSITTPSASAASASSAASSRADPPASRTRIR